MSAQTQQAWNIAANSGNAGADQYNAATAGYLNALDTCANDEHGGAVDRYSAQTGSSNLSQYMDPYASR